jgi:hypothetical protein
MKKLVVLAFALLLSPLLAQAADNPVIGTWRLQSYVREVSATGQRYNLFGDKPDGYIGYAPDGRMYALFINTDRVQPRDAVPTDEEKAKLFSTVTAYAGTYTLDSEKVVHHVDVSWNQAWTGTDQVRFYKLEGDTLTITTAPYKSYADGQEGRSILVWKKVR